MKRDWIIAVLSFIVFAVLMEIVMVKLCGVYSIYEKYLIFRISHEQGCGLRAAAKQLEAGK